MIKVNLNILWKVAVLLLLGLISFYGYRVDVNTRAPKYIYYYSPTPVYGCGTGSNPGGGAVPDYICLTPNQASPSTK
jgi:hypothetical protein